MAVLGSQAGISLMASVDVKQNGATASRGPVWPSGKALGWQAEGPRLDSPSAHPFL